MRYSYEIYGIVQGVGFRPFVYKLATKYNLFGYVQNNSQSLIIEVEGDKNNLENFDKELRTNPPPLSKITKIKILNLRHIGYDVFTILPSNNLKHTLTLLSPDMAICDRCIDELRDKKNKRYNYYFINCTDCGARYSIISHLPYDRENTSMKRFVMCKSCSDEYNAPTSHRYHAQPISCDECSPSLILHNIDKSQIATNQQAIIECANLIKSGKIVAIKSVGGFHIVCDSQNSSTIQRLRELKQRPTKPFAIMCKDIDMSEKKAHIDEYEKSLLSSIQKPIVLLKSKQNLPNIIAPNIDKIGIFLPTNGIYTMLFDYLDFPIIATSANISQSPIIANSDELVDRLSNVIEYYLDTNIDIVNKCDDSVVMSVENNPIILRLSRGYAPLAIKTNIDTDKCILSFGANQKSSIAFNINDTIITTPYIADLANIESIEHYKNTLKVFERIYNIKPNIVVCDKHPEYESTKLATIYAKENNIPLIQIQHHYAHALSVMAEHNLTGEYLCFCFDGTGYGDDGTIWGGEVLICDSFSYKRVHHFSHIKLLGSQMAIKEPKRVAISKIFEKYRLEELEALDIPTLRSFSDIEIKRLYTMYQKNLNAPLTSSVARLFDIIASFCDILQISDYEGDSGIMIESFYDDSIDQVFDYTINEVISIDFFRDFTTDKKVMATRLINTLFCIIKDISNMYNLDIILCGGVFQNKTLLAKCIKGIEKKVYYNTILPINDQSISVGGLYGVLRLSK